MERHPLQPFLPPDARLLMLGSFPPPRKRWSMDFFYPNWQNDMWRIFGLVFFNERDHFVDIANKCFRKQAIVDFLNERGIALYDTASVVNRMKDNASDKFLEVIEQSDIDAILRKIPLCQAVATTGQKATDTLRTHFASEEPQVGRNVGFFFEGRAMRLWRMPSSSRAYPLALEKKVSAYHVMMAAEGIGGLSDVTNI